MQIVFKTLLVLVLIYSLGSKTSFGQNKVDSICQVVNIELLNVLNEYQFYVSLGPNQKEPFLDLFKNENVFVQNDIIPWNSLNDSILLKDYVYKSRHGYERANGIKIIPLVISPITFSASGKKARVSVSSLKVIRSAKYRDKWTNEIGVKPEYRAVFIAKDTFKIKFYFDIDFFGQKMIVKISKIASQEIMGSYVALQWKCKSRSKTDSAIINTIIKPMFSVNGDTMLVNRRHQLLLKNQNFEDKIVIKDHAKNILGKTTIIVPISDSKDRRPEKIVNNTSFRIARYTVKLGYGIHYSPSEGPTFSSSEIINDTYKGSNMNIELGVILNRANQALKNTYSYWQVKTGIGYSMHNYSLSLNNWEYEVESVDSDGDEYLRISKLNDISESVDIAYLNIPVLLEKGFDFSNQKKHGFGAYISAGTMYSMAVRSNVTTASTATYAGSYGQYYNLVIAENGVYDFGDYDINKKGTLSPNKNTFHLIFSGGLQYYLSKSFAAQAGVQYKSALSKMYSIENSVLSTHKDELNNLSELSSTVQLNYFVFDFGILIRL